MKVEAGDSNLKNEVRKNFVNKLIVFIIHLTHFQNILFLMKECKEFFK